MRASRLFLSVFCCFECDSGVLLLWCVSRCRSRHGARVPHRPLDADIYDIKQYTRDPRNLPKDDWVQYNTKELSAGRIEEKPVKLGSKGSKVLGRERCA